MTEVLCVAYTYTSTFATQSARTTLYLSLMRGYTTMPSATTLLSNPCGLALIRMCKHTHFTITALCAYAPPLISTNDNHIRTLFETGCLFLCKIKSPDSCQDLLLLGCLDIFQVFLIEVCACLWRSEATPLVSRQAHVIVLKVTNNRRLHARTRVSFSLKKRVRYLQLSKMVIQ